MWLVVSQFREREPGRRRLALFVPLVVLGLAAEAGWYSGRSITRFPNGRFMDFRKVMSPS